MGPCGEDPLLLAAGDVGVIHDGKADSYPESAWPEVLLIWDGATGQISAVDPTGVRPSNPVFEIGDGHLIRADDGVLTLVPHDEESGALVLQLWPEDPWTMKAEPVVLHDGVRLPGAGTRIPSMNEEEFLLVTTADELVAVSRLDGELTTIATDVYAVSFSYESSDRYLAWQSTEVTNDDPLPVGPIFLLDRQTNEVTHLTDGDLSGNASWIDELDMFSLGIDEGLVERFYRLPSLESFGVSSQVIWARALDDARILVLEISYPGMQLSLVDAATGELTRLSHGQEYVKAWEEDALVVFETDSHDTRTAGKLWRVSMDGETELLARNATHNLLLTSDRRVVTPSAIGADWTGSLVVVDPTTLDEQVIDEDVLSFAPKQVDLEVEGDPVILYGVAHPERQGVWLARLAP